MNESLRLFSRGELGGIAVDEYSAKFFYNLTSWYVIVFIIVTYVKQPI